MYFYMQANTMERLETKTTSETNAISLNCARNEFNGNNNKTSLDTNLLCLRRPNV